MRVGELIMLLIMRGMMWKSTSSNGWEYWIMWKDLGSSLIYALLCYY